MMRLLRAFCGLLALFFLMLMLVSCGASRPVRASARARRVVATAGEVDILYEELYFITMNYIKELKLAYGEDALESETVRTELENLVWSHLLTEETALVSLGYEYGLDVHKGDIADRVAADIAATVENEYEGDRKAYIAGLEEMHMTEHYARKSIGVERYLANEIKLFCRKNMHIEDATVYADLEKNNFICIRRVLVKNETGDAVGDAAALATAERIRAELAAITDVQARCAAMNEAIKSPTNKDFGDTLGYGYYFPRGYMTAEYETALFALDPYEVAETLKTDDGYYVIMRMPIDMSYVEKNLLDLKDSYYQIEYNRLVTAEYESLTLEKTRFGERLDLTDLPPIDVDGGSVAITVWSIVGASAAGIGVIVLFAYLLRRKKRA
ncbi:MAG: hypothetical protein IJC99_00955 [Clostridia bacterium]|nr:hypothetical protein [Clostridia bacterium]